MTIRERIKAAQKEIRSAGDLTPGRASELLAELTSLLGNVLDEIRESEMAYNAVLMRCLDADEAANRATIRSKTTPEYARAKEAKDTHTVLVEMIRSLKAILRSQSEEMRLAR